MLEHPYPERRKSPDAQHRGSGLLIGQVIKPKVISLSIPAVTPPRRKRLSGRRTSRISPQATHKYLFQGQPEFLAVMIKLRLIIACLKIHPILVRCVIEIRISLSVCPHPSPTRKIEPSLNKWGDLIIG